MALVLTVDAIPGTAEWTDSSALASAPNTMNVGDGTSRVVNDYDILTTDVVPHDIDATAGPINLNLPAVADWIAANPGLPFIRVGAINVDNAATVTPDGVETINGANIYTFTTAYESLDLYAVAGEGWRIR